MLVNLAALAACGAGWLFRDHTTWMPGAGTLLLEAIGVDHRYAGAGKWKEERIEAPPGRPFVAAREGDLGVGQMKLLHAGDRRIVLARTEEGYRAFDDRCPHRGGPLSDGALICGTVQCPWHGSQFDVDTGKMKAGPASEGIATYPVEVADGEVRLTITPHSKPLLPNRLVGASTIP